jgi:hypothetical protein
MVGEFIAADYFADAKKCAPCYGVGPYFASAEDGFRIARADAWLRGSWASQPNPKDSALLLLSITGRIGHEQFKIRQYWSRTENPLLPREAIVASLKTAQIDLSDLEAVAFTSASGSAEKIISSLRELGCEQADESRAHRSSNRTCCRGVLWIAIQSSGDTHSWHRIRCENYVSSRHR